MRNLSRISFLATRRVLQRGLSQLFLTYQARPHYNSTEQLSVFVSDNNNTDECYNDTLFQEAIVNIRVVAVADMVGYIRTHKIEWCWFWLFIVFVYTRHPNTRIMQCSQSIA
jgi:hypothetical protein